MILRRVARHVREQNWTAIGIELVIVVIGVFLGIQVSNWNTARQERTQQRSIQARLLNDFELIAQRVEQSRASHIRIRSTGFRIARF